MHDAADQQPEPSYQTVFHFEPDRPSFDDLADGDQENRTWSARQLMDLLGYSSWDSFRRGPMNKAMTVCCTINQLVADHFVQTRDGDFRLSKFACYLVAMTGDPKKPAVAHALAYFAVIAEAFQKYVESNEDVERVEIRQRLTDHEKSLIGTAARHGVEKYAFFHDKGYMGLYNMRLAELRRVKGVSTSKRPLLDFMGRRELAANLFRLTETEARIEQDNVQGQVALEAVAFNVGRSVRGMMTANGGTPPEDLPLAPDIQRVKTDLKATARGLKKADGAKGRKQLPPA